MQWAWSWVFQQAFLSQMWRHWCGDVLGTIDWIKKKWGAQVWWWERGGVEDLAEYLGVDPFYSFFVNISVFFYFFVEGFDFLFLPLILIGFCLWFPNFELFSFLPD